MTDKLTDAEVKKALECCANLEACEKCPMASLQKYDSDTCEHQIMLYALDLINRQEGENEKNENIIRIADKTIATLSAENESLKAEVENLAYKLGCLLCHATGGKLSKHTYPLRVMESYVNDTIQDYCDEARAEAYKEFAERLKNEIISDTAYGCDSGQHTGYYDYQIKIGDIPEYIDNLLNELVGDGDGKRKD